MGDFLNFYYTFVKSFRSERSHGHNDFEIFKVRSHAAFFIIGILSIFGNMTVVVANCLWLPEKTGSRRLVLGIAMSEIIATSCYLWGFIITEQDTIYHQFNNTCEPLVAFEPTQPCVIQAFVMNIFALSSFMHHAFLSCLIVSVIYKCSLEKINLIIRLSKVFPWIIAIFFPLVASLHGVFGFSPCSTAGWCWLGNVQHQQFWVLISGRFWEISTQIIIYCCYGAAISEIIFKKKRLLHRKTRQWKFSFVKKRDPSEYEELEGSVNEEEVRSFVHKLLLLPLCFSLCYLPGFIRYEVMLLSFAEENITQEETVDKIFYFLHGAGNCMTGIPNFFIFVLSNQHVKDNAKIAFINCINNIRQREVKYQRSSVILTNKRWTDSFGEDSDLFAETSLLLDTTISSRPSKSRSKSRSSQLLSRQESDLGYLR